MSKRRIRQYAVYLGKPHSYPQGEKLVKGKTYDIDVVPPDKDFTHYRVDVRTPRWSLYIPYASMRDVWEDWMPYKGKEI